MRTRQGGKMKEYFENAMSIYFAKMYDNAIIPTKERENAGYDFYACFAEDFFVIEPYQTRLVPTGIAWASSEEFYLQIEERSGTGSKGIKRSAGVIDSGYRGEIKIAVFNATRKTLVISKIDEELLKNMHPELADAFVYPYAKAIAQGVVHRVEDMQVNEISYEELSRIPSTRGTGAWGHSGK